MCNINVREHGSPFVLFYLLGAPRHTAAIRRQYSESDHGTSGSRTNSGTESCLPRRRWHNPALVPLQSECRESRQRRGPQTQYLDRKSGSPAPTDRGPYPRGCSLAGSPEWRSAGTLPLVPMANAAVRANENETHGVKV